MDTLTFDTSTTRRRDPRPVTVDLCGETITVRRPKDSVLYFASTISANDVAEPDRASAIFQFLEGTLEPADHKRYFDRILDRGDPINARATVELVNALVQAWKDTEPATSQPHVTIEPQPTLLQTAEPVRIVLDELDIDVVAYPPKDLLLFLVAASISTTASVGAQAWAIGMFLDGAFDAAAGLDISRRLRDRDDDLDVEHISQIVVDLVSRWSPRPNRAQRRAASRASGQ